MHSQASRFPVELGSVRDQDAQVGRLHRLALAGGPCWGLARLLRRGEVPLLVWCGGKNQPRRDGFSWASPELGARIPCCRLPMSEVAFQGEAGLWVVGNRMQLVGRGALGVTGVSQRKAFCRKLGWPGPRP